MDKNQIINLTDLAFRQYCEEKYGLNKGIYNTIDDWFYKKGFINIQLRRYQVLEFIHYHLSAHKTKKISFGSGGLVKKLNEYVSKTG
ncbi:hypothetical protein BTR23_14370 [Alkalihalophilus pseudofirmus]|nr:hypothetical protein BTR23_14370 [Alkalihalophilus pseudofirmus]